MPDLRSLVRPAVLPPGSSRRPDLAAAINAQYLAGHEGTEWSGEEFHNAGDFIDHADAVQRSVRDKPRVINFASAQEAAGARVARCQSVDVDVVRPQLFRQTSSVFDNAGFCRGVNRTVRDSLERRD